MRKITKRKIICLEPGLTIIKNALSREEQYEISRDFLDLGRDPTKGFWRTNNNKKTLNSTPYRGRMFGALHSYPENLTTIAQKNLALANQMDKTLKLIKHTHAIILYYETLQIAPKNGFIPWHQDNGENDGDGDYPVVAFNLGDSCEFLIAHNKPKVSHSNGLDNPINLAYRVLFESGDMLLFGGYCRNIWHSIYKIFPNTTPSFLSPFGGARLNITLRYTPNILGNEERFVTQEADSLKPENQFYNIKKMK